MRYAGALDAKTRISLRSSGLRLLLEGIQLGQKRSFSVCHLQLKPGVFPGFCFRYFDTDFFTLGIEITKQTVVGQALFLNHRFAFTNASHG
jgi:hypothetical protein